MFHEASNPYHNSLFKSSNDKFEPLSLINCDEEREGDVVDVSTGIDKFLVFISVAGYWKQDKKRKKRKKKKKKAFSSRPGEVFDKHRKTEGDCEYEIKRWALAHEGKLNMIVDRLELKFKTEIEVKENRTNMSIFFVLLFLLHLSTAQDDCTPTTCSKHGPTIRFPFRLKDSQPPNCGYPGFDLSCSPGTAATLLNLSNSVQVLVTNIDYESQSICIKDPNKCLPQQLQNLNLSTTPFQFADSVYNFSLFSCPSSRPVESFEGPWWSTRAACLSGDGHEVYVEYSGMSIYFPPQLLSCRKMYNVWSVPYEVFDQTADLQLTWPQRVCGKC
ncbi:hypothetical protein RHGRI_008686 [Rhododendron griersonianum]|uniref:RING-type E3 ubiquitin transferase n=1 Tax=Rhododendron griersonianum TaxID=479676 RepID=A0AAV6L4C3_9ERIC|nr:hypothetical protein RHGRI_008686 [Rhododendron griersonianum]